MLFPEDIENFTTANFFSNYRQAIDINHNYFPVELKSLYEDKIKLLKEKVKFLEMQGK
ncbi:MAG: hypothetical protein SFY32_01205 [Bacteroidota bacterium]|nr:hypothetical protein [Bacteroidota bacterium]